MYKNWIIISAFILSAGHMFAQNAGPVVKHESLKSIKFVSEITPVLWPKMWLPYKERTTLDQLSRMAYSESFIYPNKYNTVVEYRSVEIIATCYGKTLTAAGFSDALTTQQKNILSLADVGSDLIIKIGFKFKGTGNSEDITTEIVEGNLLVTVLPEIEAEFPGGYLQITEHLKKAVKTKMPKTDPIKASVKFTVNEDGKVSKGRIFRTSGDKKADKLLLEAITNMPKWKPARNSKGSAVKQEFHVQLNGLPAGEGC